MFVKTFKTAEDMQYWLDCLNHGIEVISLNVFKNELVLLYKYL